MSDTTTMDENVLEWTQRSFEIDNETKIALANTAIAKARGE